MDECLQALGECVRSARKNRGLTQVQVADCVHADSRTVLNIENCNDDNPKMETLVNLIRFLQIDPRDVFYPELREESPARRELELVIKDCSEEEVRMLIRICQCVLDSVNSLQKASAI